MRAVVVVVAAAAAAEVEEEDLHHLLQLLLELGVLHHGHRVARLHGLLHALRGDRHV